MSATESRPGNHVSQAAPPKANPKDSMKSTWRFGDRSQWTAYHWVVELMGLYHWDPKRPVPVHEKSDKVPYVPQWTAHGWILFHAAVPLAIHQAWASATGTNMPALLAVVYYTAAFLAVVVLELREIRRLGHAHGFLDGDVHDRDGIPDIGVARVVMAGPKTAGGRMAMAVLLTYRVSESPADVMSSWNWWAWLFFQIGLYGIVLDFWFYWYHRAMHETGFLWKFHRTHHLSKHPNPSLAAYADEGQEFFDMVGVPFMTFVTFRAFGVPLDFYSWWICHQYVAFTEFGGHSGLRLHIGTASTFGWLLKYFNMELLVEDHDLHHRTGWRKSHNYGKQTRVWDRIFGTCGERIELKESNIDYANPAPLSLL
ncbi:Fatty acid hydroxylase [Metarhizium album ARSEF 1941]|uniref:Fatty acid hydroxylase n=1 Tax=Metarhizium album (strain ARSEF 1941) TaxID=1081103 RepID=A0A0B2X7A9_METAS|nr:Fatty acid hydroxylase [Metarhizium album ARSEF 1941]KHO01375.1 Fatty acid hydroxylase [Metarhizium album ARSEF 1941]